MLQIHNPHKLNCILLHYKIHFTSGIVAPDNITDQNNIYIPRKNEPITNKETTSPTAVLIILSKSC